VTDASDHLADRAITVTDLVGHVASFGAQALPVAQFLAGFFPGMAPVLQAITIAQPILARIAAGAPQAAAAIAAGRPVFDAIERTSTAVVPHLKELYAIAVNHDPARPETKMTGTQVSDVEVKTFASLVFTPGWTNEEQQRAWDRASISS